MILMAKNLKNMQLIESQMFIQSNKSTLNTVVWD